MHDKMFCILAIREMQIKTLRSHLIPLRVAIIKDSKHKILARLWGKNEPFYTVCGIVN